MREKEGYREMLQLLKEKYPDKIMLNYTEVGDVVGCNWRTAKKRYPFVNGVIAITKLASCLCG